MGVERFYSGIINPGGGMFKGAGDAGVYDGILPGATGAPSGELTTRSVRTVKIDPYTGQPAAVKTVNGLTPQQIQALQAVRSVPASAYMQPRNQPLGVPGEPRGFSFADTGNIGRATGPMTQQLALAGYRSVLPGMFGRGQPAAPVVPDIPTAIASAPAGGVGPGLDDLLAYVKSDPVVPAVAAAADLGNGGQSLAPLFSPAPAKSGPTGVGRNGYSYVDGKNVGYSAEEKAKRDALGKAIGDANRKSANQTYSASGERNAFMPTSYQNSVRQQTGY